MTTKHVIAVYDCNRSKGGPEEGGWWYSHGELIRTVKVFGHEGKAIAFCHRMNELLDHLINRHRRPMSSVLCEGHVRASIWDDAAPKYWPEQRPTYE